MATKKAEKIKWACPKCGAEPGKHGKGGDSKCEYTQGGGGGCCGFLCECDGDDTPEHGSSYADPCGNAVCYHCGWYGVFPKLPGKLPAWAKKALAEGWTPPDGWTP